MSMREIVTWPAPILKKRCEDVEKFDSDLHTLLDDMMETMKEEDGLGLAANQVADSRRVFVMGVPSETEGEMLTLEVINPSIGARRGESKMEEGCLSFPDLYASVLRAHEVDVSFVDRHGQPQTRSLSGLSAVCFQHEFDHLNGVTFVDRLSPLKRRLTMRSYNRNQRQRELDAQDHEIANIRRFR